MRINLSKRCGCSPTAPPRGEGFEQTTDQYMLGDRYMVAPVVNNTTSGSVSSRTVKLPKGNWVDDLGKKHRGGQVLTLDVPLNRLVYFVRQ